MTDGATYVSLSVYFIVGNSRKKVKYTLTRVPETFYMLYSLASMCLFVYILLYLVLYMYEKFKF
jgi:hypothetical protein